jgi:hypothetical protein
LLTSPPHSLNLSQRIIELKGRPLQSIKANIALVHSSLGVSNFSSTLTSIDLYLAAQRSMTFIHTISDLSHSLPLLTYVRLRLARWAEHDPKLSIPKLPRQVFDAASAAGTSLVNQSSLALTTNTTSNNNNDTTVSGSKTPSSRWSFERVLTLILDIPSTTNRSVTPHPSLYATTGLIINAPIVIDLQWSNAHHDDIAFILNASRTTLTQLTWAYFSVPTNDTESFPVHGVHEISTEIGCKDLRPAELLTSLSDARVTGSFSSIVHTIGHPWHQSLTTVHLSFELNDNGSGIDMSPLMIVRTLSYATNLMTLSISQTTPWFIIDEERKRNADSLLILPHTSDDGHDLDAAPIVWSSLQNLSIYGLFIFDHMITLVQCPVLTSLTVHDADIPHLFEFIGHSPLLQSIHLFNYDSYLPVIIPSVEASFHLSYLHTIDIEGRDNMVTLTLVAASPMLHSIRMVTSHPDDEKHLDDNDDALEQKRSDWHTRQMKVLADHIRVIDYLIVSRTTSNVIEMKCDQNCLTLSEWISLVNHLCKRLTSPVAASSSSTSSSTVKYQLTLPALRYQSQSIMAIIKQFDLHHRIDIIFDR